jgi:hypothetical protein
MRIPMRNSSSIGQVVSNLIFVVRPWSFRKACLHCIGVNTKLTRKADLQPIKERLLEFLQFLTDKNVPLVIAAGNKAGVANVESNWPPGLSVADDTPGGSLPAQAAANTMIVVGAVDQHGSKYSGMSTDNHNLITTYAPGVDLNLPKDGGALTEEYMETGTSPATAIVVSTHLMVRYIF